MLWFCVWRRSLVTDWPAVTDIAPCSHIGGTLSRQRCSLRSTHVKSNSDTGVHSRAHVCLHPYCVWPSFIRDELFLYFFMAEVTSIFHTKQQQSVNLGYSQWVVLDVEGHYGLLHISILASGCLLRQSMLPAHTRTGHLPNTSHSWCHLFQSSKLAVNECSSLHCWYNHAEALPLATFQFIQHTLEKKG